MTLGLMVDEPRWWWRGRLWAHLASDDSIDELHRFAATAGLHQVSFGGDHYDVTEEQRRAAIAAGAEPVAARELVRRLRHSGLRRAHGAGSHRWDRVADTVWDPLAPPHDGPAARLASVSGWVAPPPVADFLGEVAGRWAPSPFDVRVLRRRREIALLLHDPTGRPDHVVAGLRLPEPPAAVTVSRLTVPAPMRLLELFLDTGAPGSVTS